MLASDLPRSTALLERMSLILRSYLATNAPGVPSISGTGYATVAPSEAVANVFATSVGLAASAGIIGPALAVIRWLKSDIRQALGPVDEQLSANFVSEQVGFQKLPFDQPKHGFDG